MTREDFAKGWAFLTAQPWGRAYDGRLEPEKAQLQFELYFHRLSYAHPTAWQETAILYAAGESWPSLDTLRRSLSETNRKYVTALPAPQPDDPMTDEQRAQIEANLSRLMGKPFTIADQHFPPK